MRGLEEGTDSPDLSLVLPAMQADGIDALVFMEPHTVAYFLNYWNEIYLEISFRETPCAVVITSAGEILLITPKHNYPVAHSAPWIDQSFGIYTDSSYYDQSLMVETLARTLQEKGLAQARVGFEMGFVPASIMDRLRQKLPEVEAVDGEWILWKLRSVKTPKQLGFINTAVRACEEGITEMLRGWTDGQSLHKLLSDFDRVVSGYGASFLTAQRAVAKKWAPFAGRDQKLSEDFLIRRNDDTEILLDLIVKYQGYVSDWKRAFYLGTPSDTIVSLYEREWRAVRALADELEPGMTTREAQEACDHRLESEGISTWWCIHSVGLEIHEEPLIGASPVVREESQAGGAKTRPFPGLLVDGRNERITFEPNVVVMVETKSVEDPYIMTEHGLRRLNSLPQELFVL